MKRCSVTYAIRKLQIKTTMRYNYTPSRMAKIQNTDNKNAGEDVEHQELSFVPSGNETWYSHFERQFGILLQS